ncbi:hypothetical protein ACDQ55_21350 [Chitinophaga sp. 30R24]|uniref:hypothetical protein n=1 Tax=Chitinophaga sp. 30R24 TaxID=3248838 RepID=UPI003B910C82
MIRVLAELEFFKKEGGRNNAIVTGYRPVFNGLNDTSAISGRIILLNREFLFPGEKEIVEIDFLDGFIPEKYLTVGKEFTFEEGLSVILGKGFFTEIIQ